VTAFSYQTSDGPVILATLEVINREFSQFATPQATTQYQSKNRSVPLALQSAGSGSCIAFERPQPLTNSRVGTPVSLRPLPGECWL
jgi:hypothetical protein